MEWLILIVGAALQALTFRLHGRLRRVVLALAGILVLVVGGVLVWYTHRPLPDEFEQKLFRGITYTRDVRSQPRPLVIHIIDIDLDAPGISFLVTPPDPYEGRQLRAQTTSHFLDTHDAQVAINGDFFEPWWSYTIFDYYPHVGDPVDVHGLASSRGVLYAPDHVPEQVIYFSADNRVSIGEPLGEVYNAISGNARMLTGGELIASSNDEYLISLHPRTAIGLNADASRLLLALVDGRQPNYSEGVTLYELAQIMAEYGAADAINLDGGGSTTLVAEGENGLPLVLNSPIDNRIPGRERPVGNHLGIFAQSAT